MANYEIDKYGRIIRDNIPVNTPGSTPTPRSYTPPPRPYTPPARYEPDIPTLGFYLLTIALSAVASWLLALFAGSVIFDPSRSSGGITGFFINIGPYIIFLGGFAGCFWYNVNHSYENNLKEIFLSVLSAVAGCVIFGIAAFLLSIIVQIIIVIVIIAIAISIFGGG